MTEFEMDRDQMLKQVKEAAQKMRRRTRVTITCKGDDDIAIQTNVPAIVYLPILLTIATNEIVSMVNAGKMDMDGAKVFCDQFYKNVETIVKMERKNDG